VYHLRVSPTLVRTVLVCDVVHNPHLTIRSVGGMLQSMAQATAGV
jgi:hypothetical protein